MDIIIATSSYNQRRMGRPWIAKVDFAVNPHGDFVLGDWAGDHYNGGEGVLKIDAVPGDIIATGQKDNRKSKISAPEFFAVTVAGDLDKLGDKGAAYKYYLTKLKNERERLIARLDEINKLEDIVGMLL